MESEDNPNSPNIPEQQSPFVQTYMTPLQGVSMNPGQFAFPIPQFQMPHMFYPFFVSSPYSVYMPAPPTSKKKRV